MGIDFWGPRFALILGILFLVTLILFLTYTWIKGYKTESWNQIEGKVAVSKIAKVEDSEGYHFQAIIQYSYEISGATYTATNWYRSGPKIFQSKRRAEEFLREYPENKTIPVYVNPKKEAESCLRTMEDARLLLGIFVAVFMLLFCIARWASL